jgi:hypothetical protein
MLRLYFWWLSLGIFSVAALGIASDWLGFYVPLFVQLLALGIPFVIAQLRIQSNPSPIEQKISDRIREFDECWQGNFRKFFLNLPAIIRKLLWQENRPRFHIDRKIAEWSCYFGVVPLLVLGFLQAFKFAGSYKGIVYPIPPLLFAHILLYYDAKNFQKEVEIAERGYRVEEKIDELLQPFADRGGIISQPCRQEGRRREDMDRFLFMPSGDGFAISAKSVGREDEKVKVSFDPVRQRLRLRKGRRGRDDFKVEPTLEHKERVRRFLSDGLIPSCRAIHLILVFPPHVELNLHKDSPVEEVVGGYQFLKFNNVWVLSENEDLALLIEALHRGGDTQKRPRRRS